MRSRLGTAVITAAALGFFFCSSLEAETDGLVLKTAPYCSVWWAPGATKIKRTDPLPVRRSDAVVIRAAKNEYEPYQIVLVPAKAAARVQVEAGPLRQDWGGDPGRERRGRARGLRHGEAAHGRLWRRGRLARSAAAI